MSVVGPGSERFVAQLDLACKSSKAQPELSQAKPRLDPALVGPTSHFFSRQVDLAEHWLPVHFFQKIEFLDLAHFGARMLKSRPPREGGTQKRLKIWLFLGGKHLWNALKFLQKNPDPLAHHFHRVSLPRSSGAMRYHAKPYHLGQRLLGSVRGWKKHKRVREGDDLKSKQNTSMTVSKSRPHHLDTSEDGGLVYKTLDWLKASLFY